ncbi:hypothetical protein Lser_V15G26000 [Lactuca serriola]
MAPNGIIDELEKIRRRFLWSGKDSNSKIHWVSWCKIVASKKDGGLGVGTLKAQNLALLTKWWWRLKEKSEGLWRECLNSIHNLKKKPVTTIAKSTIPGVWSNIAKAIKSLVEFDINYHDLFTLNPGSNINILFWKDHWCGHVTLQEQFPRLYDLEEVKTCLVSDRLDNSGFHWRWRSRGMKVEELDDLQRLSNMIQGTNTEPTDNGFRFNLNPDGKYIVNALRQQIDSNPFPFDGAVISWSKSIPLKIRCFIWRAVLDRLPVAMNLARRGVSLESSTCPLCNNDQESRDHLLIKCEVATEARAWILKWCGISVTSFDNVGELINFAATWGSCSKRRKRLNAVLYGLLWFIWLAQNNKLFKGIQTNPARIADE